MISIDKTTRREFLQLSITAAASVAFRSGAIADKSLLPPNIILITADDLGYGDLSCYGATTISTPNLDRMAREGVRFTDFYSGAPVCTPSRACLMTGRYAFRTGMSKGLFPRDDRGLPETEVTIAQALKRRGYTTAHIGKWHLGHFQQYLPTRRGFDYYYGIPYSNDTDRKQQGEPPIPLMRGEKIIEQPVDQTTLTQRYTKEAVRFIRGHRDQPFLLYLAHNMPHVPLHVCHEFRGKSKGGLYGDAVEEIDWGVGRILSELRTQGLDRNTLVMFTSDNGPWLMQKSDGGSAGPLRAGKNTVFDGGMRVPFIARRPGYITAGRICRQPASQLDLWPTFVSLGGGRRPSDRAVDGRDIRPLLTGSDRLPDYAFFYHHNGRVQAVRFGKWKLHVARNQSPLREPELYNLDMDVGERQNAARQHPNVVDKLRGMIESFK